ncbi:MAG: flagellar biosynthetic protein FliR [Candidatus Neomarinimicrobiota bacterium]
MNLSILDLLSGWGVSFMLVMTRVSAMIYAFPFFGSPAITMRVRVLITLVLSFMLLPVVGVEGLGLDWNLGRLAFAIGRELALGLIVGFGTKFMFEAFSLAGTFAGRQMGFAIADLVDPVTSAPQSMVGQFWALVAILLFVAVDGHHFLIQLLVQNFRLIPLETGALQPASGRMLITGSSEMFQLALKLAAPALILTLMMDVGVGVLSRAMPRLQVFFVALPLKLFVGVFALVVSLQLFQALFSTMYFEFQEYVATLMATLRS